MDLFNSLPPDLLNTNRAPNHSELVSARAIIPHIEDELSKLCGQIAKLESAKRSFEEKASKLKSVFAPLRRVPEDIICLIFECCIDEDDAPTFSSTRAPILLTHISSGLRKIALAMPTLWNAIDLYVEPTKLEDWHSKSKETTDQIFRSLAAQKAGMEEWLRRSETLPLKLVVIYCDFPTHTYPVIEELYYDIFHVVQSCHARWSDVTITVQGPFEHETLVEKMLSELELLDPDSVPLLHSLHLDLREDEHTDRKKFIGFMPVLGCPTLKSLSGFYLDGLHAHKDLLNLSMTNLTYLECSIGNSLMSGILTTLGQFISLTELRIHIYNIYDDNPDQKNRTELPSLEIMDATGINEDNNHYSTPTLMEYISAPNLKRLSLQPDLFFVNSGIVDFAKHAQNLTTLYFDAMISFDLFIEMLRYCPQLTYLERLPIFLHDNGMQDRAAYDKLFTRLVDADDTGNIVCPKLERMVAGIDQIPIPKIDTLHALITRKTKPSQALASWKFLEAQLVFQAQDKIAVDELLQKCDRSHICLRVAGYADYL